MEYNEMKIWTAAPKTARNYKPQEKRDIVTPKKRQSDQINGVQNRMNLE